jgi:hypothetical protein
VPAAPRSLCELPFIRYEPLALLGLRPAADGRWRREPDPDYAVFGWAEADAVVLEADDGTRERVEHALVLALHSTNEPAPHGGADEPSPHVGTDEPSPHVGADEPSPHVGADEPSPHVGTDEPSPEDAVIELELDLPDPDGAEPLAIRAPLDRFLAVWLPRLPATAPHVVLALCNPRRLDPARPRELGARHLHYAHGDVLSWLDAYDDAPAEIRLHAHTWHRR